MSLSDGGSKGQCVATPLDVDDVAGAPWIRLPPPISERVQLVSLTRAEGGFLALAREKLGTSAKDPLGYRHSLFSSPDGIVWQENKLPELESDKSLRFNAASAGMSRTIAVGGSLLSGGGTLWSSAPDGTWELADIKLSNPLQGVALTSLGFAAFGDGGVILISADGVHWTSQQHPAAQIRTVACSADECVFGGTAGFVVLSTQGRTEASVSKLDCDAAGCITDPGGTQHPPPVANLAYGQERFWAETQDVGSGPSGFHSEDGLSWKKQGLSATPQAFLRDLAIRRSETDKVQVWAGDGATHTILLSGSNPEQMSCKEFECIILRDGSDIQLLLAPGVPKSDACD